jgi:hypothetical protein
MKKITVRYTVTQVDWYKREIEVPDDFDATPALRPGIEQNHEIIEDILLEATDPHFNSDACYDKERGQVDCFIDKIEVVT